MTEYCGSVAYHAPEIENGSGYSKPVDLWALGIVLYEMTTKNPIYSEEDMYNIEIDPNWDKDLKDLFSGLLEKDQNKRYDANFAIANKWVS